MIHEAQLVRATHPDAATLATAERDTGMWIRVLDKHGGGFAARPEVAAALAGKYGSATRLARARDARSDVRSPDSSGALDTVHLFVALPDPSTGGVVYVARSTRDVKLQLLALRHTMIEVLAVALAVTALLTLVLATTIARPLGRLTRRAQRIAARQAAASDTLDHRRDEIGQLARAVTAMTDELERRARDARTLAADISHELKTPLSGIRGAAELMRDPMDDADRDRFLAMILDDSARIDRIVSRLLELARVEDDRAASAPVDVAQLARDCAARSWPVPVDVEADAAVMPGRAAALASAIDNLVANAVQHAAPSSRVKLAVSRGVRIRVAVANHGPALSEVARARVWDRFYSTRTEQGGSGLGLAIVRSVALAHGGTYGVSCAGGVTTFWFEC
jgi:two-component system sensor histidine kinase ChvG